MATSSSKIELKGKRSSTGMRTYKLKGLVNLQKLFKLLLIEKSVMRETESQKPHQKNQNSYQVMKVSKFYTLKICKRLI